MRLLLKTCSLIMLLPTMAIALEGGSTSSSPEWKTVTALPAPDAAQRKVELDARQTAIANDIQRLRDRLKTTPAQEKMDELHRQLKTIHANYGWEPQSQLIYGRRSIEPMLKGQRTMPKNLLAAFVQLDKDLKARGIDLIILPLVPTPHFHAHTLVDGIEADDEYFPGWTEMTIEMLENDLEVIDTVDEFRKEADNDVLVSWANDFHTGSMGRQLAAKALAERLQRYDFAKDLAANRKQWSTSIASKTGASFPQRILVVNGAFMSLADWHVKQNPSLKRWQAKKLPKPEGVQVFGGKKPSVARDDLAPEAITAMRNRSFKFINLTGPKEDSLKRTEVALIGDSQLHSAIYGSGLPEFIMAETGGRFRWGSKSWSGFSPPEIYREVVPDSAVPPRVVVLSFLPKYFWHVYDRKSGEIDEKANKYKPRPLPAVSAPSSAGHSTPATISTRVTITKLSEKPTEDPATLDYDEALMHVAAVVKTGPLKGKEIGLRYWILHGGSWTKADQVLKVGNDITIEATEWDQVIASDATLSQHQIFNDTEQDFLVPIYWVTGGTLAPSNIIK